jgi:glycine dehydrogenase subunit 2
MTRKVVSLNGKEVALRNYHAPVWDEPVVMTMSRKGRRGIVFGEAEEGIQTAVGSAASCIPPDLKRGDLPNLPEMSEYEVLRHYLHLSQETLGMIGMSLFGTCTMKYNPRLNELIATRPQMAELHPYQDEDTLQGLLEAVYKTDLMLRALSGMDRFVFQAGGGADASYAHACVMRAHHAVNGELAQRDEVITTIFTHCCNPATAATAGFKVINLMPEGNSYPSLEALKAAVSERTAGLMIVNPDDLGIYNPQIDEWVKIVHDAGGLCFYDHANFNGVMGMTRARDIGFDACMFMLHKTFGAPKGGMGPAAGAYGCSEELARFLPVPLVSFNGSKYYLDYDRPYSVGKIREFWGNLQLVLKAYAWLLSMGAEGIVEACQLSVIGNNYLEKLLMSIPGVSRSYDDFKKHRLELTRMSWAKLQEDTGVGTLDVQNRMTDFGIDAYWLSHDPWLIPEPFTPETGETYPKEDIDYWAAVLKQISDEAYSDPELVKTAPHNQAIHKIDAEAVNDSQKQAMTWRAYLKKRGGTNTSRGGR